MEGEERRILARRLGEQPRRLGIAFAAQALRIALGLGHGHGLVAVGLGADRACLLLALGAQRAGHLLALGAHAVVDLLDHVAVGGQVDLLEADVDDAHAQGLGALVDAFQLLGDHLAAVAGHQLGQGAGVDLVAQRVLDDRRQAVGRGRLVAAGGAVEGACIVDVADGHEVHAHVLALGGQVALGREVDQGEPAVEGARGFHQRPLEMQPRADVGAGDTAQIQDQGDLAFADHVHRTEQAQQGGCRQGDPEGIFHRTGSWRPARCGSRVPLRSGSGAASMAGSTASAPTAAGTPTPGAAPCMGT